MAEPELKEAREVKISTQPAYLIRDKINKIDEASLAATGDSLFVCRGLAACGLPPAPFGCCGMPNLDMHLPWNEFGLKKKAQRTAPLQNDRSFNLSRNIHRHDDVLEAIIANGAEHAGGVGGVGLKQHVSGLDDLQRLTQEANVERNQERIAVN